MIINGKKIQARILSELKQMRDKITRVPRLGAILVGDDQSSISFLKEKERIAKVLDINFVLRKFSIGISRRELRYEINRLAKTVDGLIIQLPLPQKFNKNYFLEAIPLNLDVDMLSSKSLGLFLKQRTVLYPPAVMCVLEIFREYKIDYKSEKVIGIVGRGLLVGKPLATFFINQGVDIMVTGARSQKLPKLLRLCDIIISSTGIPNLIEEGMLKKKAVCIDFGYYRQKNGKVSGDFASIKSKQIMVTPPLGGTGPITVACLYRNLIMKMMWRI